MTSREPRPEAIRRSPLAYDSRSYITGIRLTVLGEPQRSLPLPFLHIYLIT